MDFRLGERRRKKSAILRLSHFQQLVDQGLGTEKITGKEIQRRPPAREAIKNENGESDAGWSEERTGGLTDSESISPQRDYWAPSTR